MKAYLKKMFADKRYLIFVWHGFFLALTMSMIDFNTVFPSLVSELIDSKIIFGLLYSLMLGVPLIFNLIFSHYLQYYRHKKKFLLLGIYLRGLSFLGMAVFTYYFGGKAPFLVIGSFFIWILIFSLSGGFAGLAFTDIIGKLFQKKERGQVYAAKQFFSSLAALLGGLLISRIFSPGKLAFPANYSLALFIGFIGLFIASIAFWFIEEPSSKVREDKRESLFKFIKKVPVILRNDSRFFRFILVENMAGFSLMVLPFYIVFARESFNIGEAYIGRYLLFQIAGSILSNLFWGLINNRLGSRWVVRLCILLGAFIPLTAILISPFGPDYFALVFVLIGFIISGRRIGFDPFLLEIAPDDERTLYLGIRGTLSILVVLLPLIGGLFIEFFGYHLTFGLVILVMLGAFFLLGRDKLENEGECY